MLGAPTLADPEVAAATFQRDLTTLWESGRPAATGWGRITLDSLTTVIAMPGVRPDGTRDWYFLRLGAEYYDSFPPTVLFVNPADWSEARHGTRWFPVIAAPNWFGLHDQYTYSDGPHQLVCFTAVAQYYMVGHGPPETTVWKQGRDTVAKTLNRLAEVLGPPHYQGPSG